MTFARNSISTRWGSYGDALFLSPDGRHLLTVHTDQTFSVWDTLGLAEGKPEPLPFKDKDTWIAAVAPGGRLAAFGSRSGEVMLWDAETGQARPFARLVTNHTHRLVFSPNGRSLADADNAQTPSKMAATNDTRRTVRVWDVRTVKETHVFSTDGEFPWSLTFSADSRVLMAGCWKGQVKLWPLDGQGGAATFPGHSGRVEGLALLPDGHTLISSAWDIRFWDVSRTSGSSRQAPARKRARSSSDGMAIASLKSSMMRSEFAFIISVNRHSPGLAYQCSERDFGLNPFKKIAAALS